MTSKSQNRIGMKKLFQRFYMENSPFDHMVCMVKVFIFFNVILITCTPNIKCVNLDILKFKKELI